MPPLAFVMLFANSVACSSQHPGAGSDAGLLAHVSFTTACAPTTTLTFDATPPGESAMAIVFAINDSDIDVALGDDLTQLSGTDASEFMIAGGPLNCTEGPYCTWPAKYACYPRQTLSPHAWCALTSEFHPTAPGTKQASYVFCGGAGVLALSGSTLAPPGTFHADRVNVANSYVSVGSEVQGNRSPPTVAFKLINDSAQTVSVGTLMIDSMYNATDDCPASLTPGGACNATVSLVLDAVGDPPQIADCRMTQLTSSTSALTVPVSYTPAPAPFPTRMSVWLIGDGAGEVTSSVPAGVDCTAADASTPGCARNDWAPPSTFALTAMPAAGSEFVGWFNFGDSRQLSCGNAADCSLPLPTPSLFQPTASAVEAWFAPATDKHVNITIVGSGNVAGVVNCDRSCTLDVTPGQSIDLTPSTTGTFVGWSGDCTGTANCQLGSVINDRNVTATFTP